MEKVQGYKRQIFLGIVIVSLGIVFTNLLKDEVSSLGVVFVAIGGFFLIVGMSRKRKEDHQNNQS